MGDALAPDERSPEAVRILLIWAVARLRPDRRDSLADIDETAWLHSTSWRPMLTLACHHGLLAIPAFPQRYRRRQDEAALENLCGIWAVGPSTVYRYLDKARRQLTDLLSPGSASGADRMNLRRAVLTTLRARVPSSHPWEDWHRQQGQAALLNGEVQDALWHFHNAGEVEKVLDVLRRNGAESAASDETDELLATLESGDRLTPPQRIELQLQWAALWRLRSEQARAEESLGRALRQAEHLGEPLYIGMAQASLGHHLEERDRDRAIGMFEDSLRWLRRSIEEGSDAHRLRAVDEYAQCVVHLAWLHLRRNNPKARTLLDQVAQLQASAPLDDRTVGSLEQAWGEYWRCAGNPQRALEHKHRALTIYQRLGDHRSVLNALRNLSLIYSDAKDFDRAIQYGQQVIDAARTQTLEPEVLAGAHGNIGIAYFFKEQFDRAIEHYLQALALQNQAGLRAQLIAVHYNLAEAYYELFKRDGKRQDEEQGDIHATTAARLSTEDNAHAQADAARSLKREVIGTGEGPDRLLPTEHAAHFSEMAEIERLRLSLALPQGAEQQVRTHLAIARAYLSIATKEREAAVAIANRHGLQTTDFQIELETLRATFSRELTREQQLDQDWHGRSGDLLAKERRQSVLAHVLAQGSINKSAYAEAAAVSLATASKHLGLLAERGLLVQTGKGPSTRYLLPSQ
jgi:tetratricopeptide (TPR) repeat protein